VRELTDPETGERIPFDAPSEPPAKSAPPDRPTDAAAQPAAPQVAPAEGPALIVWIAGGAVLAGLMIWVVATRFKR
jgi:hypothetical protein